MAVPRASNPLSLAFPAQGTPITPDATEGPASAWYRFFEGLWRRTGSQSGSDAAQLTIDDAASQIFDAVSLAPKTRSAPPPYNITVTASPFAFQAPFDGSVVIQGGTVSATVFSRSGAGVGNVTMPAGIVKVAQGDKVTVTYSVAPTMTWIGDPL